MERPEFMQLPLNIILQKIIEKYNLNDLVDNGWVYVRIDQTMYSFSGRRQTLQQPACQENEQSRLPPMPIHTRTLEARVETRHLHSGS